MTMRKNVLARGAAAVVVASLWAGGQQARAGLSVTTGSAPVVGVTLGMGLVLSVNNDGWGSMGGYSPGANAGAGGYFPTAANAMLGAPGVPGGAPALGTSVAAAPPPYPIGSSGSFNSTGASELTLPGANTQIGQIHQYDSVAVPPEVVYDFAQAQGGSSYASLNALTGSHDTWNTGGGQNPGYIIAPTHGAAGAGLTASVSPDSAGVFWSPASGPTYAVGSTVDDTYTTVSISTGAFSATNNGSAGITGRTTLVWSASGYVYGIASFIEFGLNGNITSGPAGVKNQVPGAGPIVFDLMTNLNGGIQTEWLSTGSGANSVTLTAPGASSQTFANGSFIDEGFTVTPSNGGYDFTMWAVSASSTFSQGAGADLAGTATATIFAHFPGSYLTINPGQLPTAYSSYQPGFTYSVPEPTPLLFVVVGGIGILAWLSSRRQRDFVKTRPRVPVRSDA